MTSMVIADLVKSSRRAAGITQADLARRACTTQPAVAAYESGARMPSIATLKRLLSACDHDLEVVARPRVRRGATPLTGLPPMIATDLQQGRERDAVRLLFEFADDFRGSSRPGKLELLRDEPPPTGDKRFDAALAGMAEFFSREANIPSPPWVENADRFVEPWWFVTTRPSLNAYTLAQTPAVFARHGVFIAREVFDRA